MLVTAELAHIPAEMARSCSGVDDLDVHVTWPSKPMTLDMTWYR